MPPALVTFFLFMITTRADRKTLDASLLAAVARNDTCSVSRLLRDGARPNARYNYGYTALTQAAGKGFTRIVLRLIRAGAKPNTIDGSEGTPLMAAAQKQHYAVVRLLVKHGAKVNRTNSSGFSPLMAAAIGGDLRIVRFLIKEGANVNARIDGGVLMKDGSYKDTPITLARHWGHDKVERLLRNRGAKE